MTQPICVFLAVWCLAACWLAWQLARQNGRILMRLEALEERLSQRAGAAATGPRPSGLPIGAPAPHFRLPDVSGSDRSLSDWRGRPVLLVFFEPKCGFCRQMVPALAALASDPHDGSPVPLVISGGTIDEARELAGRHGLRCTLLLQRNSEVSSRYLASGTPTGYLLDEHGRIASELTIGAEALLALAGSRTPRAENRGEAVRGEEHEQRGSAAGDGRTGNRGNRALEDSRLNRSGLVAGTLAPSFRLPRLDEGELGLDEYRGRQVLLVFSDARCGPCDQLAPRLEVAWRERSDVQILMVCRGDAEASRLKVAQFGLTFPVGLQRQWEISRLYGMFATPIAYLIDGAGVISADVAIGVEPILGLLEKGGRTRPVGKASTQAAEAPMGA